jgi:TatD DNase family protein
MSQLPLIDSHCHLERRMLAHDAFALRALLDRCRQQAIEALVVSVDCSGGRPEHDIDALDLVFEQHGVRLAVSLGFMPPTRSLDLGTVRDRQRVAAATMRSLAGHPRVVAVGEVGLDYYWPVVALVREGQLPALLGGDAPPPEDAWHLPDFQRYRDLQRGVFEGWIALAHELDLPLVIHERLAHADTVDLLAAGSLPPERVMFHCFGAGPEEAQAAAARGSVVSIPSSVVIRERYRDVAAATPLEAMVIETDSPYHSPIVGLWKRARQAAEAELEGQQVPRKRREHLIGQLRKGIFPRMIEETLPGLVFRSWRDGKEWELPGAQHLLSSKARSRNEPTFVRFAASEIATLQGRSFDEVQRALLHRTHAFFGL